MPSIDVAMARSLRGGLWGTVKDNLVRGLAAEVMKRDAVGNAKSSLDEFKEAFSSWDNCMQHSFCKWPVIAVIAVGGLIILGITICIIRCCCCGLSCCCSCCYCLKCCGDCCGCCDAPGGKKSKYLDEPYNPQEQGQGYRQQAPMEAHFPAHTGPGYQTGGPPQYAEFDVSKKQNADALPAMPSWEGANSKQVALEGEEAVEMDHLHQKEPILEQRVSPIPTQMYNGNGNQQQRIMTRNGPYDPNQNNSTGYMNAYGQQPQNAYGARNQEYDHNRISDGFDLDQPYDAPAAAPAMGMGPGMGPGRGPQHHQSPGPMQNGYGQPRQISPAPAQMPAAPYNRDSQSSQPPTSPTSPYGMESRMRNSPGPGQNQRRRTPGPLGEFQAPPSRMNSPNSPKGVPYRTYSPAPPSPRGAAITNNSGFDFNSGFSRPQTRDGQNYDRRPSESNEHEEHEAYPGYKPYAPAHQAWSGV